jgi:DNA-binding CsgD family transcriptional regulator
VRSRRTLEVILLPDAIANTVHLYSAKFFGCMDAVCKMELKVMKNHQVKDVIQLPATRSSGEGSLPLQNEAWLEGNVRFAHLNLDYSSTWTHFCQSLVDRVESLGFSDFQFSVIYPGNISSHIPITTLDSFEALYVEEGISESDIIKEHAFNTRTPFFLSSFKLIAESFPYTRDMKSAKDLISLVEDQGFKDSFTLPVSDGNKQRMVTLTVFSKSASQDELKTLARDKINELVCLADAVNLIGFLRFPEQFGGETVRVPTQKQKKSYRALYWVSLGCSYKQVAEKMNIAEVTVRDHLRTARMQLNAKSTANAVRIAMTQGLIDPI